jgi:hypothetical protein
MRTSLYEDDARGKWEPDPLRRHSGTLAQASLLGKPHPRVSRESDGYVAEKDGCRRRNRSGSLWRGAMVARGPKRIPSAQPRTGER